MARRIGVRPGSIILNGPNKTQEELSTAIKQGIKLINADSLSEIEAIDKISACLGLKANLAIRVNPGIVPKGMSVGTATGSRKAQFGVDLKTGEALQAFRRASALDNVNLPKNEDYAFSEFDDYGVEIFTKKAESFLILPLNLVW